MRGLKLAIMTVLLMSCATPPITKEYIRNNPVEKSAFIVNKPYQEVFATLLAQSRACYRDTPFKEQLIVSGNRNNADKNANISISHVYAMAEQDVYIMIDLSAMSPNQTSVVAYTSDAKARAKLKIIKQWALDNSKKC